MVRTDRHLSPLEKAERGYRWETMRVQWLRRAHRLEQAGAAQAMAERYHRQLVDAGLFASEG